MDRFIKKFEDIKNSPLRFESRLVLFKSKNPLPVVEINGTKANLVPLSDLIREKINKNGHDLSSWPD